MRFKLGHSGFTLIELVMVIIIIGILAAIAVPRLVDISDDAKKATAKGVGGSILSSANLLHAQYVVRTAAYPTYNLGTQGSADPVAVLFNAGISGVTVAAVPAGAGAPTGDSALITITISGSPYTMTFTGGSPTIGPRVKFNF